MIMIYRPDSLKVETEEDPSESDQVFVDRAKVKDTDYLRDQLSHYKKKAQTQTKSLIEYVAEQEEYSD